MATQRAFRLAPLAWLPVLVCWVAAAEDAVKPCADGTVASYLGTSCSQGTAVTRWLSYSCTSTPESTCAALGTNGSGVNIKMDPQGPYTLLVGKTTVWSVTAGQKVDVAIGGTVYGARGSPTRLLLKLSWMGETTEQPRWMPWAPTLARRAAYPTQIFTFSASPVEV